MKLTSLYKSKLGLFTIQIMILTFFIFIFQYNFPIEFDGSILVERRFIIQFLANYIMYEWDVSLIFMYSIWILVLLIPVIVLKDIKKVLIINITTFFFPNFFFYIFLSRYSPIYFELNVGLLFLKTFIFALIIASFSLLSMIVLNLIRNLKKEVVEQDITLIEQHVKSKCPYCGTEFNSNPIYCYKCNNQIVQVLEDTNGKKE
ncbi:MAG: hypothetical protein ACFFKA_00445 [Candidatus Thorarchaeota archaeon]